MVKTFKKVRQKIMVGIVAAMGVVISGETAFADSAIGGRVESASTGFVSLLQSFGKPATMAVIAGMGLLLIVATQHQKENVKDGIIGKIIGVAALVLAVPAADAIWGIF